MYVEYEADGKTIKARVWQKVDTLANWEANTLVIGPGEQAFVVDSGGAPINFKIGDGTKRFSELPWWIDYAGGQYVQVAGNALPTPTVELGYSFVGPGTYTHPGQPDIVAPDGRFSQIVWNGTSWVLKDMGELPENIKYKMFVQGNTYYSGQIVWANTPNGLERFMVKLSVPSTTKVPVYGSTDWDLVELKGRESTFKVDASNANLISFYNSIEDIYIIDSNDTAKAEDFLIKSVWVNDTAVNSQVRAFGMQIQRLNETPVNFGVNQHRTSADLPIGELYELRPVGGTANFRVFVKLKSVIPASTSFNTVHDGRILNTSSLQFRNIYNAWVETQKNKTFVDPKFYPSRLVSDWFRVIKNIYIYDTENVRTDVYALAYVWMNDPTFGKFGMQITKNGANNSNFTIKTATPVSKGTYRLDLFNTSQPLKNISIVVEFNDFGIFPTTSGSVAYTGDIFTSSAFKYQNDKNAINLLGATSTYKLNKITVTRNANDFLSIRETIMNITDASEGNRYEVYVPAGLWYEVDIQTKEWVDVYVLPGAIVECDSNLTDAKYVIPTNYPYPSEIGKQWNTVDFSLLHTFWVLRNSNVYNQGIISIKRGKYTIHIDSNSFDRFTLKGGILRSRNALHAVGVGIWGGQSLDIDCEIDSDSEYGIGIHNWNNQTKGTKTNISCTFNGCDYLKLDELGSNQIDEINLNNCTTNAKSGGSIRASVVSADGTNSYYKDGTGNTTNNPNEVPYNFRINAKGTVINEIKVGTSGWSVYPNQYTRKVDRILDLSFINGYVRCLTSGSILKGEVVSISNITNAKTTVVKYNGDSSNDAYGVAIADAAGGFVWVAVKGKIADTLATGVNFSIENTRKLTYSGGLVSTPTAKHYEVIAEATENSIGGYVRAKLK